MLIEFSVENYKSIKDKVTFSMLASSDKSLLDNVISTDVLKKDRLLRSAVIYGANASGKSNTIFAMHYLRMLVSNSHEFQEGMKIPYYPFKLDKKTLSQPTKIEVIFIKNKIQYIYGFSVKEFVIEEYLYYYPKNRKQIIFHRKNTKEYNFSSNSRKEQNFFKDKTPDNVLYISRATQLNYEKTKDAFNWITSGLRVVGPRAIDELIEVTAKTVQNKTQKQFILNALSHPDIGIEDIKTSIRTISADDLISKGLPKDLAMALSKEGEGVKETKIYTKHGSVAFNMDEESQGTQKYFSLLGPWIESLMNGYVLIIDELDTKLHHLLTVFLINLFNDPTQNTGDAQLIFTTHDINLLDQDIFRRDQIWFTERKTDSNSTDLYSLLEYKPRKDKNIRNGYLAGRYGALPFIKTNRIF